MFIRPFLIATAVLIPHIYGQLFVPLLIDNLAELAIAESLGPSEDVSFFLSQTPNFAEFVSFLLYRTIQDDGVVLPTDPASLSQSPMDPTIPTKIIVVGFLTEPDAEPSLLLRSVYLETGEYNFIVVNWTRISKDLNFPRVRTYVRGVASAIGKFLDALADSGVCLPKDQHIIGHSLGGHLAGLAAMAAKTRPGRCTGLDPSAPLFELASSEGRIDSSVATIVDVIHTAAGSWGLATPVGHVDFYVNGGTWPQPDCRGSFHDLDDNTTPTALGSLNIIRRDNLQSLFPNLEVALRMYLSIPVSNCSAERAFSKMARVKSVHRSTMRLEQLNALSLLSIERNLLRSLCFDDIIDDFSAGKAKKSISLIRLWCFFCIFFGILCCLFFK